MTDARTMVEAPPAARYRPYGLLAEVTYRCPLHCPYCSNPTKYPATAEELTADEWGRVLREAADLGVLHVFFSGGEPLARGDLHLLVAAAREAGLYTNLITSAVGLSESRARQLKDAGLNSVQISFQAAEAELADAIAGAAAHAKKLEAARLVREVGLPLSLNVVLHRANIEQLPEIIDLAERLGAERLELANTQFYGWAFVNKQLLLPTRRQLEKADRIAAEAQSRLQGRMQVLYVLPDYYGDRPKPCMNGWGQRFLTVNSVGDVLPCQTAVEIPGLRFDNVRQHALHWIWHESEAFNQFRGTAWLPEPCQSCERREIDFGGCRCQAALLTGNAANTDPACSLSPHREAITRWVDLANVDRPAQNDATARRRMLTQLQFRRNPSTSSAPAPSATR
jgi:pyrroloquinoline quinone biosynthesis protein E